MNALARASHTNEWIFTLYKTSPMVTPFFIRFDVSPKRNSTASAGFSSVVNTNYERFAITRIFQ